MIDEALWDKAGEREISREELSQTAVSTGEL